MSDVTPNEIESSNEESEKCLKIVLFEKMRLDQGKRRSVQLHHDHSIARWAFLGAPEVRQHVSENMTTEHGDVIERVVHHLHIAPCPKSDPELVGKILRS